MEARSTFEDSSTEIGFSTMNRAPRSANLSGPQNGADNTAAALNTAEAPAMSADTVNPAARAGNPAETQTPKPTVALKLDRPCKLCGCPLAFAPDIKSGKPVAIDLHAGHPIYFLVRDKDGRRYAAHAREFLWSLHQFRQGDVEGVAAMMAGVEGVGVMHQATCKMPTVKEPSQ